MHHLFKSVWTDLSSRVPNGLPEVPLRRNDGMALTSRMLEKTKDVAQAKYLRFLDDADSKMTIY